MTQEQRQQTSHKNDSPCCGEPFEMASRSCCGADTPPPVSAKIRREFSWQDGTIATPVGQVSKVTAELRFRDHLGAWRSRWGIRRMDYRVEPGLYALGEPTTASDVYVSANYKMSFDRLRSALHGRDGWIMVLDTKGINVWCAAGKGTFGTDELVRRIKMTRLSEVVSHRQLILPQLGATGVSAHRVKQRSGFKVIYGPVRAKDLPTFLDAGMKATPEMRRVLFRLGDRLALIPIELVGSAGYLMAVVAFLFFMSGFGEGTYSFSLMSEIGLKSALLFAAGYVAGTALTPALLPWLPGRAFSIKGACAGVLVFLIALGFFSDGSGVFENKVSLVAWFLLLPTVSSFLAMNFTGASTYTSLSGVKREMRFAVPLQAVSAVLGLGLWITSRFV